MATYMVRICTDNDAGDSAMNLNIKDMCKAGREFKMTYQEGARAQ